MYIVELKVGAKFGGLCAQNRCKELCYKLVQNVPLLFHCL